jgi:hypothetical protein
MKERDVRGGTRDVLANLVIHFFFVVSRVQVPELLNGVPGGGKKEEGGGREGGGGGRRRREEEGGGGSGREEGGMSEEVRGTSLQI